VITWDQVADRHNTRTAARQQLDTATSALAADQAQLARLLAQIPPPKPAVLQAARVAVEEAAFAVDLARAGSGDADQEYETAMAALPGQLDPTVPCLLLPLRLETRFTPTPAGLALRVRIYPDDVHSDTHEPALTDAERRVGEHYWKTLWDIAAEPAPAAGVLDTRPARRLAAWEQLSRLFGPTRAAWVATALTPTNRPPATTGPQFPVVSSRPAAWTRAGLAAGLPERWVVRAWRDGQLAAEATGELIRRPLSAGPGPEGLGPDSQWMADYDQAVDAGMAVILHPSGDRVDLLTVVGVRGTDTPADGAALIGDLLDAHHYTWGLDLLPFGTPTNNTPQARAGQRAHADPAEASYRTEREGLDSPGAGPRPVPAGTDAAALSVALGLGRAADPLATLEHATDRGQADAEDMAAVLWPATWGYYLEQLLTDLGGDVDLAAWRRWVVGTVRGRGPLPALRVGNQPYGVLPVTPLDRWRPFPDQPELALLTVTRNHAGPHGQLRIGFDLDAAGRWTGRWTDPVEVPGTSAAGGCDLAAADLDGDGRDELVALVVDPPTQTASLLVSGGISDSGGLTGWQAPVAVPTDEPAGSSSMLTGGVGVAVARLDDPPRPAVIVALDSRQRGDPSGHVTLRVGTGVPTAATTWSVPSVVPAAHGVPFLLPTGASTLSGATTGDLTGTGRTDLVLLFRVRAPGGEILTYRVGRGLTVDGQVTGGWTEPAAVPVPAGTFTAGATLGGASLTLANLTRDPPPSATLTLLVHYVVNLAGTATGSYLAGTGLTADGAVSGGWAGPFNTGGTLPSDAVAVGAATVTAGRDPAPGPGTPTGLVNLLAGLQRRWDNVVTADRVPRLGAGPAARSLLDVLTADDHSSQVRTRGAIGPQLAGNLWRFASSRGLDVGIGYGDRLHAAVAAQLGAVGLPTDARLTHLGYETDAALQFDPLVADPVDEQQPLTGTANYLAWAATARPDELHDGGRGDRGVPLLHRLARHATLQVWADAAFAIRPPQGVRLPLPEPELVDVADLASPDPVTPSRTLTSWRHLAEAVFPPTDPAHPGRRVADVLADLVAAVEHTGTPDRRVAGLVEHRARLRRLAQRPTAVLERTLMETLDLAAYRLDAWITAVATSRLRELRRRIPTGLHVGAFGMLVDLTARHTPLTDGYVHAPSLGHAATAAILRSGYLSHADDPAGGQLAVDLTSRRVRLALELLDGLGRGQPLGALLGARFERGLHDRPGNLDRYLGSLRELAPATASKRTPLPAISSTAGTATAAQARGVLDGLALLQRRADNVIPWGAIPPGQTQALPPADPADADHAAILAELDTLQDAVDALADLAVAEAVHQTVHGNPIRAGALLDALNRGQPVHADPEVVRTARSGIGVTHRLLAVLPGENTLAADVARWAANPDPAVRAAAEPRLNAWAATVLGEPARTRWRAQFPRPRGAAPVTASYTLASTGLCPLDLVYAAGGPDSSTADGTPASGLAGSATLNRLLLLHAAAHPPPGPAAATPTLLLDRDPAWAADELTVPELLEIARRFRELIAAARPAGVADLAGPAGQRAATPPDPTLTIRASAARTSVQAALDALRSPFTLAGDVAAARTALGELLPGVKIDTLTCLLDLPAHVDLGPVLTLTGLPAAADLAAVRAALRRLALAGIPGAAPDPPVGIDDAARLALFEQAQRISTVTAGRLAAATAAGLTAAQQIMAALGEDFVVLPQFTVTDPARLSAALAARRAAGDADEHTVADWLDGAAAVRAGVARLGDLRLAARACGRRAGSGLQVAQLPPPTPGGQDRWAALPLSPTTPLPGGLVDLILAGPPLPTAVAALGGPLAGLLLDEWVEVVPNPRETTAVTFHLDAPGASPPQTLLLAVSPTPDRPWTIDLLEQTVRDTLTLAKQRAVDPDLLPPVGHFLPALLLARNTGDGGRGDTIATLFPAG
jgi:hypothetical protein